MLTFSRKNYISYIEVHSAKWYQTTNDIKQTFPGHVTAHNNGQTDWFFLLIRTTEASLKSHKIQQGPGDKTFQTSIHWDQVPRTLYSTDQMFASYLFRQIISSFSNLFFRGVMAYSQTLVGVTYIHSWKYWLNCSDLECLINNRCHFDAIMNTTYFPMD